MAEVVFADPLGNDFQVISLDRLLLLVRTKKERYWNSPSSAGSASLYYYRERWTSEDSPDASLDFTMRNRVGFHLYYSKTLASGTEIVLFETSFGIFSSATPNAEKNERVPQTCIDPWQTIILERGNAP